ncbi:hypothetical protein VTJ04DRAFT_10211 [Mycothermus thermophilus]|uniref:uncharacterized protein n=1 Tax=Humicola insolens TaxID=85995 RepID=UPI003743E599
MSRWLFCVRAWHYARPRRFHSRFFSSHSSSVEHVQVQCASAGSITLSLHNISRLNSTTPLVIVIPPFSRPDPLSSPDPVPSCFRDFPVAVIHYRWQPTPAPDRPDVPLYWPTPVHDITFGYSWLAENLGSSTEAATQSTTRSINWSTYLTKPRPAYVYGSYLGASLAAGLALTESHLPSPARSMVVRGLVAYNGIYNWTEFLPDHPIHKAPSPPRKKQELSLFVDDPFPPPPPDQLVEEPGAFTRLKHLAPSLFANNPGNLFDPFASACLFFQTAPLHVPEDFTTPLAESRPLLALPPKSALAKAIDALAKKSQRTIEDEEDLLDAIQSVENDPGSVFEDQSEESAAQILAQLTVLAKLARPPRMGYLVFPPRQSDLRIPACLFLHDRPRGVRADDDDDESLPWPRSLDNGSVIIEDDINPEDRSGRYPKNSFSHQSLSLASLLLRSLDMHELRRSPPWDPDRGLRWEEEFRRRRREARIRAWRGEETPADVLSAHSSPVEQLAEEEKDEEKTMRQEEMERRVQTFEVVREEENGDDGEWKGLNEVAEGVVAEWLRERIEEEGVGS